ncbi:MAG TPA: ABC transporter permease [Candidatus Methylacidiphilales bacterium]|nr:ABC transporter permease [Candidatus Methylacidiphilales bacterium]
MIVLENISKTYLMGETTVVALRNVSLRIERGEFVSLVGASGSGKSTLLHMIGLLDRPDTGALRIGGHDTSKLPDDEIARLRSETIGFVFQQFHLLKRMTAFDNVELPLIYAKGDRPSADPAALLERVGLGPRSHHKPNELSGGQQQRVAIARALVRRPLVVLADEPTGNLDSHSGAEIMALLRELHAEGLTVVLVTHEPSIAAAADRTIRVHDGEIIEDVRRSRNGPLPAPEIRPPTGAGPITAAPELEMSEKLHWNLLMLNFQQAARGLWANKLRTCLSALGIIIGVAAVIVMLALGHAAELSVERQIATLGSNRLAISPNPQDTAGVHQQAGAISRLTIDEAMHIDGRIPTIAAVSGEVRGDVQAVYGHNNVSTILFGSMPGYEQIYSATPTYGRFFTLEECRLRARVVLLGTTVLTGLFGTDNPVGQTIEIEHIPFTVIGVLPPKGSDGNGNDRDDRVIVPLQTAMYRVLGKQYVDWIDTSAANASVLNDTMNKLQDLTDEWPHIPGVTSNSYRVSNMAAIAQTLSAVTTTLSIMLASVAAISLVVGGIGIMNIMLVSVTERTREIGLRKALGARVHDIQAQFLIEAVTLCLGGGFLGIATGWIITLIIGYFQGVWMNPTLVSIALSCGFSVAVGIGFGYWPAVLASRLDPIEALRYE